MLMLGLKGLIVLEGRKGLGFDHQRCYSIACFGRRKDISEQIGKKEEVKA